MPNPIRPGTPIAQKADGEMTFEQIAAQLGISKARVWQLYLSGMAKLRRGRAEHLRPFLSDRRGRRGLA
jgi:DNA-directed RNA polymerase sigma subunit (sigma70/sigma32)